MENNNTDQTSQNQSSGGEPPFSPASIPFTMDRLKKQLDFILELDKLKEITRQTYLADASRKEGDAEHSWHLAVMCALLAEYSNEPIDLSKTMMMVLMHDVVEIDAGDTYAYDPAGNETKREREVAAAERIFSILPEDQAVSMRELWEEFERSDTPEARFAHTLDCVQPILLNHASGGISWVEHQVKESDSRKRNAHTAEGSEALYRVVDWIIRENVKNGNLKPDVTP